VTTLVLAVGVTLFAAGLGAAFLGNRLDGRIAGLSAMAAGALATLVAADPASPATWLMAVTGGATLVGLVVFALALRRWVTGESGEEPTLDDRTE
jgi:hypothetical protein